MNLKLIISHLKIEARHTLSPLDKHLPQGKLKKRKKEKEKKGRKRKEVEYLFTAYYMFVKARLTLN